MHRSVLASLVAVLALAGCDFQDDPLQLIAVARTTRAYSTAPDEWRVWLCDVPTTGPEVRLDMEAALALLDQQVAGWYSWASRGRYRPTFTPGSTISAGGQQACLEHALAGSAGAEGALVVLSSGGWEGLGTPGSTCGMLDHCTPPHELAANGRWAVVHGGMVFPVPDPPYPDIAPLWPGVVHEIGHALSWPHSEIGSYDNPVDVMSRAQATTYVDDPRWALPIGTLAINRYAAGWIDPTEVIVHRADTGEYVVHPVDVAGTQLVVIESGVQGRFTTIEARARRGGDAGLAAEGLAVHLVDQGPETCGRTPSPWAETCFGIDRAQRQATGSAMSLEHVLGPGGSIVLGSLVVTNVGPDDGGWRVRIEGGSRYDFPPLLQ